MKTTTFFFLGTAPLLMRSEVLVNPLNPTVKELKALTGKRKKTDDDHLKIRELEWFNGIYFDEKLGPYIPARNLDTLFQLAAKFQKKGPDAKRALMTVEDKIPLQYKGPRTLDGLWKDPQFLDYRPIKLNGKTKMMRARPIFREWSIEFSVAYDETVLDPDIVARFAEDGGKYLGLGDYRPRFGRFAVEVKSNGK